MWVSGQLVGMTLEGVLCRRSIERVWPQTVSKYCLGEVVEGGRHVQNAKEKLLLALYYKGDLESM